MKHIVLPLSIWPLTHRLDSRTILFSSPSSPHLQLLSLVSVWQQLYTLCFEWRVAETESPVLPDFQALKSLLQQFLSNMINCFYFSSLFYFARNLWITDVSCNDSNRTFLWLHCKYRLCPRTFKYIEFHKQYSYQLVSNRHVRGMYKVKLKKETINLRNQLSDCKQWPSNEWHFTYYALYVHYTLRENHEIPVAGYVDSSKIWKRERESCVMLEVGREHNSKRK